MRTRQYPNSIRAFTIEELALTLFIILTFVGFLGFGKVPAITGGAIGLGIGFVVGGGFGIVAAGEGISGALLGALLGAIIGTSIGTNLTKQEDSSQGFLNHTSSENLIVELSTTAPNPATTRQRWQA